MTSSSSIDRFFTHQLPKVELHAHLSGSISRQCLHEIWVSKKSTDPNLAVDDPIVAIPPGKVDYDLQTFFPLFSSYIYKLCNDLSSIRYSTNSVLDDFQSDGVVYLELRTTPRAIPEQGISKDLYVDTVLQCLRHHMERPGTKMVSKLILSVDRRWTVEAAQEVVDLAIKYRSAGVVGVDLCGDPSKGDIRIFEAPFRRAKQSGLCLTLHFAEDAASSTDQELSALLGWEPDRLGHVIHVKDEFKQLIVKQGIGVELCLSCNIHAKMITGTTYSDHHFGWWRQHPGLIALSTDDVGVFCSPLSEEYYLAATHFNLGISDIKELCEAAINQTFAPVEQKQQLRQILNNWFNDCPAIAA